MGIKAAVHITYKAQNKNKLTLENGYDILIDVARFFIPFSLRTGLEEWKNGSVGS